MLFCERCPYPVKMRYQFRHNGQRKRDGSVFFPFAVMYSQNSCIEIKIMDTEIETLEETQSTAIEQLCHQIVRIGKISQYRINFLTGEDYGYIRFPLCSHCIGVVAEILL